MRTLVALLVAALLLGACSVERSLDADSLSEQIQAQLFPEHPDLVSDVNCPRLLDPAVGDTFSCAAQIGSQIVDVPVVLGGEADNLTSTAVLDERFVPAQQMADLLAATFTAEVGIITSVDCGQPVVVLEPGETLICTATDPAGVSRQLDVAVADDGSIDLEIR